MEIREEYKRVISLIVLFIIISLITFVLKYYFKPFFLVLVFIIASTPIYNLLENMKMDKHIAAFTSILFVNLLFIGIIVYFGNYIIQMIQEVMITNKQFFDNIFLNLNNFLNLDIDNFMVAINKMGGTEIIKAGALTTGEGLMSYFVGNVFTFFFLVDKNKFLSLSLRLVPKEFIDLLSMKNKNLKGIVVVQGNLIIISIIIMSIGFVLLRVDRPIFLACFAAIIDILPYVGIIIVFIPIIIYNIIMKNYFMATGFIILYILLVVVREILEAKFLSNKLDLHPLIVFLSIYIGLNIFGLLGVIIGPIYCMLAKDIIYNT